MQSCATQDESYLRELQAQLEDEYDMAAAIRLVDQQAEQLAEGNPATHPRFQGVVRGAFGKVREYLKADVDKQSPGVGAKYKTILRAVNIDSLVGVVLINVIRRCLAGALRQELVLFQGLAAAVGRAVCVEAMVAQSKAVNPEFMRLVMRDLKTLSGRHRAGVLRNAYTKVMRGHMVFDLSQTDYIHIGKFGVDACYRAGLIADQRGYNRQGTLVTFQLTEAVMEYITGDSADNAVRRVVSAAFRRMLCKPDPWTGPKGGGFLTERRKHQTPLIAARAAPPKMLRDYYDRVQDTDMPEVYACANYLQETAYILHSPTLDLVRKAWETGGGVFGIPPRKQRPKPEFPMQEGFDPKTASPEDLQTFRMWKRRTTDWYSEQRSLRSKQLEIWDFLRNAGDPDQPRYYPVFMDKRGRWYYRAFPNPQGSDVSRSLLHFAEKKPLGDRGLYWLKVHIANCLGVDDIRFDKRVQTVDARWPVLERALDDPLDRAEVFGQEAPLGAYSACWELREAYRSGNPEAYATGIPVHMDATVSGTQHFSALLLDEVGARYSNLFDSLGDTKEDMYTAIAEATMDSIRGDLGGERGESAKIWYDLGIPRSLAKRPCMTFTYGITLYTTQEYIYDWLDDEYPELARSIAQTHVAYLARKLFDGIGRAIPATVRGMEYLQKVGQELGHRGEITWNVAKTNMLVQHMYHKSHEKRVRVESAGLTLVTVREPMDDPAPRRMASALAPNFIHSLDAAHLTMVAGEMRRAGHSMVGIHDSFGTHPSSVQDMHRFIREQFVELYSEDILGNFRRQVGSSVELPERGSLDLTRVLDSEFMFC